MPNQQIRRQILLKILSHGTPEEMNTFITTQRQRALATATRPQKRQPKLRGFLINLGVISR